MGDAVHWYSGRGLAGLRKFLVKKLKMIAGSTNVEERVNTPSLFDQILNIYQNYYFPLYLSHIFSFWKNSAP